MQQIMPFVWSMRTKDSKGRAALPAGRQGGCARPHPCREPTCENCFRAGYDFRSSSQCSEDLKLCTTCLEQGSCYIIEWSTFSHAWHTCLFCHIICKSPVTAQDFYLQPFFSCWVFDKVNEKTISLGWVTEHNFKGILSFPTFCCSWHKSWELHYLKSSRTLQSTFPILFFQNILVFIIRYSQKGKVFLIIFFCSASNMRRSRAKPESGKICSP